MDSTMTAIVTARLSTITQLLPQCRATVPRMAICLWFYLSSCPQAAAPTKWNNDYSVQQTLTCRAALLLWPSAPPAPGACR